MKRSVILLLMSGLLAVSCATSVQLSSIEPRFQDGIYYKPRLKTAPRSAESFKIQPINADTVIYTPSVTIALGIPIWRNWWWNDPFYWDPWFRWNPWCWDPWYRWDPWYWDSWYWRRPYYDPWWRPYPASRPIIIDRGRYYYGSRSSAGIGSATRQGGAGYIRRGGSGSYSPGYGGSGGIRRNYSVSPYSGSNITRDVGKSVRNNVQKSGQTGRTGSYSGRTRSYSGSGGYSGSSRSGGYSGGYSGGASRSGGGYSGGGSSMRSGGGGHSGGRR